MKHKIRNETQDKKNNNNNVSYNMCFFISCGYKR